LPNRAAFVQRLRAVCHERAGDLVALVLFDFDRFKQVNDTLGHRAGDEILTQVAQRLKSLQGRGKMVARIGGDEFVVLVEAAGGEEPGLAEAMEVMGAFADPVEVDGLTLDVRASIGVAASLGAKTEPMALFRHAEIAMYQAKAKGTKIEFYESQKDRASLRRLTMAGHLRRAIEEGLLNLHYQPVVDLTTGKAVSCEALARWVHPELGTVGPDEFIPAAERAGLIVPLTWWAVETALHDAAIWRKSAPSLTVAVNLSPVALLAPDLAQRVDEALSRAGLGPEALKLELTETSVLADLGSKALQELAELGVGLSLDDFGTGYSSLSRLRQLPFDEVKIDRCFVTDMDENDEAVVRSVIELARGLDKLVTAEGVEDEATLIRLAELGCDSAQGFYISRPLPARQLERALKKADRWPSGVAVAGRSAATA
jgi:diguanylate cyclase (GGDEF)-like protein